MCAILSVDSVSWHIQDFRLTADKDSRRSVGFGQIASRYRINTTEVRFQNVPHDGKGTESFISTTITPRKKPAMGRAERKIHSKVCAICSEENASQTRVQPVGTPKKISQLETCLGRTRCSKSNNYFTVSDPTAEFI